MKTLLQKVQEPEYKDIRPYIEAIAAKTLVKGNEIWLVYAQLHDHLALTHIEEARTKLYKCLRQADELLDWLREERLKEQGWKDINPKKL